MLTGAADYGEGDVEVDAEFLAASCIDKQLWVDVRRQVVVELRDEEDDHQETTDHRHWNTNSQTHHYSPVFQLGIFLGVLRPALAVLRPARTPLRPDLYSAIRRIFFFNTYLPFFVFSDSR